MPKALDLDVLLSTCLQASWAAGAELERRFYQEREIHHKGAIDLVTDADRAAEKIAIATISNAFPDHAILAEESGAVGPPSSVRWILDPLDGTTNYAHKVPHFAVSIACEVDGERRVGVVYSPMQRETFVAAKGRGATLNGARIQCTTIDQPDQALMATGFPYYIRERPKEVIDLFTRFVTRVQGVRRFGSAALDLCYVAAGRFDGFFENGLRAWDMAAGTLIVEEAGGVTTRLDGSPLDLDKADVLAAGKSLHPKLVSIHNGQS